MARGQGPPASWRRRAYLVVAASAAAWGIVLLVSDGVRLGTLFGVISSRNPSRPILLAGLLALWYFVRWRHHWRADGGPLARLDWPHVIGGCAALGAVGLGVFWGSFLAAGPDASGYVSQADLWTRGALTRPAPEWSRDAPWADPTFSASPVGYRPGWRPHTIVPWYSPGLPLVMALFQVAGGPSAVFVVVPLLGGLTVYITYLLGRWLAGPWSGAAASLLVLGSPAFLVMLTSAMSDVPVTAWWTLALYTALPTRHAAAGWRGLVIIGPAVVSGIASTLAILTRPNTAPLAGVVLALLVLEPAARLRRAGIWLVLVAVSVATIALLNWEWHGSPTQSAYGSVRDIYALDRVWSNARTYARWLLESQTPLVLVALVAPWVLCRTGLRRTVVWILTIVFPLTAVAIYLPYVVFPEWSTLRFLLPAYPPVMAGLAATLIAMARRHRVGLLATPSMAALVVAFVYHGLRFAGGPLEFAAADARYARGLEYVRRVPEPAAFVSLSHSGTIAFYSGRDIVRWEALPPEALDAAVEYLGATGRRVYLVIDDDEREPFLRRFAASRRAQAIADGESVGLGGVSVFALDGGRLPPW